MSGNGPPPKKNRQRRGAPVRGDWQTLEELKAPVLPELDTLPIPDECEGSWPYTSRTYWEAWRNSPVTAILSEDDIALAIDTILHYSRTTTFTKKDGGVPLPASEFRIRMESLGLTPKGRWDSRLLLPEEKPPAEIVDITEEISGRVIPEAI